MKARLLVMTIVLCAAVVSASGAGLEPKRMTARDFGFEENCGQFPGGGEYRLRAADGFVDVGSRGVRMARGNQSIAISFVGSGGMTVPESRRLEIRNYIGGPGHSYSDVPVFDRVMVAHAYPGIDVGFHSASDGRRVEYDFHVAPGTDPASIRLSVDSSEGVAVAIEPDELRAEAEGFAIVQHRPVGYTEDATGRREPVSLAYRHNPDGTIGFNVGPYDATRTLIIDPELSFATYLGGEGMDVVATIAAGADGSTYVAGATEGLGTVRPGGFVAKFDWKGQIVYTTYMPAAISSMTDAGNGTPLLVGTTSDYDFPFNPFLIWGGPDSEFVKWTNRQDFESYAHAFYGRLGPTGQITDNGAYYLGHDLLVPAIRRDRYGRIYVLVESPTPGHFGPPGGAEPTVPGERFRLGNINLLVFGPDQKLQGFSTFGGFQYYVNSFGTQSALDLAVSFNGSSVAILGKSDRLDMKPAPASNAFRSSLAIDYGAYGEILKVAPTDGFVIRLSRSGLAQPFSPAAMTYIGPQSTGAFNEFKSIALDDDDNIFVSGMTLNKFFPPPSVIHSQIQWDGIGVGWIIKLRPDLSLAAGTYFPTGNPGEDSMFLGIRQGYPIVAGTTTESTFPVTKGDKTVQGGADCYVAKLQKDLSDIISAQLYGGPAVERCLAFSMDGEKNVALGGSSGQSSSPSSPVGGFPTKDYDHDHRVQSAYGGGSSDGIVLRFVERPVIFVPGIGASWLNSASGDPLWPLPIYPNQYRRLITPTCCVATDVTRSVLGGAQYSTMLNYFAERGFKEFDRKENPQQLTANCDGDQGRPNFFTFPYDWTKDNTEHVAQFDEYLKCVAKYYGDIKPVVVAHSMGGLVMRRFLLDHAQDATPPIDSLITVATPYLGAPKGIYVLYTGNFFMNFGDGLTRAALREVAPFVMGVAQLLPTKAYFQVKRNAPFVEEGVDDNHNGVSTEDYMTWDQFRTYLDRKFNNVVSRGVVFHDHPGQDDFRQDGPHLPKTYQFYGNRTGSTIEQVKAATVCKRIYALAPVLGGSVPIPVVVCGDAYLPVMGPGDGTVPTVSGSKASFDVVPGAGPSVNFNPPSANLYEVTQTQASGAFDHVSITAHPCVLAGIFSVINGVMPKTCKDIDEETRVPAPERAGSVRTLAENEPGDPPAWYPRLMGITDPTLIDFSGKDSVADGTATSIESPGVDLMAVSERSTAGYLQGGRDFALTFVAGPEEPLQISVDRATDPDFPESTTIFGQIVSGDSYRLILHANGNVVLSRDVARDGTFTEEILPDSIIPSNGDRTRPVINTAAVQTVTGVEVSAGVTDDRTASPGVYYSIDGAVYVRYAGTLSLPPSSATVSFVSLDEAGNTGSATVPVAFATLSGQITGGGGATVQITSGQAQFTVAADASGGFTLPSPILLGGHVTVTPARSGFVFSPPSAQISAYDGTPILFTASGIQLASLAVRPAAAGGGTTVTLTVTLSATAGDNTTVALTSSDGSIAPVPLSIIIPAGNASGSVQFNVGVPAQFTTVTVSASLGSTTKATLFTVFPASSAPPPETQPGDTIWIDDSLPGGAALQNGYYGPLHWDRTQAAGGNQSLTNNLFGNVQYSTFVTGLNARLEIGEKVVAYVRMSDSAPAREIKLVWMTNLGYRGAYWGEALTGSENTCLNMGPLPAAGGWVRLEIPLKQLGLEQTTLTKVELAHYGGQVWFDRLGKSGVACVPAVAPQPQIVAGDTVIVDDGIPAGAALQNGYRGPMHWDPSQSASGTQSLVNYYAGDNVSYTTFVGSLNQRLEIGESVVVYAHANECAVPREIKVVWYTNLGYRGAYWGEALAGGENTCINMGPIPSGITAGWVRLEIPLKQLVLEQTTLTKIELTHFGGQVWFDHLAKGGAACIAAAAPQPQIAAGDTVIVDDGVPAGAALQNGYRGPMHWDRSQSASGTQSLVNYYAGDSVAYTTFVGSLNQRLEIGEKVVVYAHVNECAVPREIKVVWSTNLGYRGAYWGEALTGGENSCINMGPIPAGIMSGWVRLEVSLKQLGLEQTTLTKIELTHFGGQVWFDHLAKGGPACIAAVAPPPQVPAGDAVLVDDSVPAGAALQNGYYGPMHWDVSQAASGTQSLVNYYSGDAHAYTTFITGLSTPLAAGGRVVAYIHTNECAPPREIKLVWYTSGGYRGAYWGEALAGGENSCINMGAVPAAASAGWTRIEIPVNQLGVGGTTLTKIELTHFGGQVWFDRIGD